MKTIMINSNLNTVEPEKNELEDIPAEIMEKHIFVELRKCGWREMPWNRYVVLSFDIISCKSLNPQLSAKHVEDLPSFVVFFGIQVINTKRFQPIGKVFCRLSTSPAVVAVCVKSFIRDLMRCEYFVVASVCRTMSFLQQVVHQLVGVGTLNSKTGAHVYKVEFLKIVHLYDPVVMLEHTFLSFLKYAFKYKLDGKDFIASYEDCKKIMIASTSKEIISDVFDHTNNIVCAMRLFSMTFYREIQNCISLGQLYDTGTAEFCALMDKMFDTLHGDTDEFSVKLNRYALTKTSTHLVIWERCLQMLSTMRACSSPIRRTFNNGNLKNHKDKITDDYECYDILNSINQMEIAIDTEEIKVKLQKRVDELEEEYEKVDEAIGKEDMRDIEIKDLDSKEINGEANIQSVAVSNDFNNDNDEFHVDMYEVEKLKDSGDIVRDYNKICHTIDGTVDIFGEYSKKLFLILKESECADTKKYDDYEGCKFDENDECVALDDCNKIECADSDNSLKCSAQTAVHNDEEEEIELDYFLSDDYSKRSTSNSVVVSGILVAFDYIYECLESSRTYEEATNSVIVYLEKFNAFALNSTLRTSEITEQVYTIHECLLKMFSILSANNANMSERQNAYEKLTKIKEQLQKLLSVHKEIPEIKDTDKIHSIPRFFDKITHSDKGVNTNITHIALNKLHQEMEKIYPEIRHFYNEIENLGDQEANSPNNDSCEKEETDMSSVAENEFRPFVLDAWQISINGAKKLFELLQKKRVKQLDMSSLNIDHIRQIFNTIKIDNGIHIENKYQIKVLFINATIVGEVFETNGALILE